MTKPRYLLFAGSTYYPMPGWNDFVDWYRTMEEALEAASYRTNDDWWHIVDTETPTPRIVEWGPR